MKTFARPRGLRTSLAAAFALVTLGLSQSPLGAVCTPLETAVEDIEVTLLDEPIDFEDYVPAIDPEDLEDLDELEVGDELVRREFAYVSTALATALGLGDIDPEGNAPNPQIRVRIATPASFSNFWKKSSGVLQYRNRESSAVFTVVGIVADVDKRLFVFRQEDATDNDSGHYKLFAADTGILSNGNRVVAVAATADLDNNQRLDNVEAHAWAMAPSKSTFTPAGGSAADTQHFCEPDGDGGQLVETAVEVASNDLLVMAPHGGKIEGGTGEQAQRMVDQLGSVHSLDANLWQVAGDWSDNQTFARWHTTTTTTSKEGFPALADVMPATNFEGDIPFRFAVAFHGFSATANTTCPGAGSATPFYQLILGGATATDNKCRIATRIREAMNTAFTAPGKVAISIRIDDEDPIEIADTCGRTVTRTGLDGTSHDNVVNWMAAEGGVQLEQSASLRDDVTIRTAVADGVAQALADLLGDPENLPEDPCAAFE